MIAREIMEIAFACTLMLVILVYFLVYFVIRYKNRELQYSLEKQRLILELEHKKLRASFEERELVLNEISSDIHDNIGQVAYLINMDIYTIEKLCTGNEQLKVIQHVAELMKRIIRDTKYMSHSLNSDFIKEQGLYRMLEFDMEQINASGKVKFILDVNGDDHLLSPEAQLFVYRIAQEAIHNSLQHADASNIKLELVYSDANFMMKVTDDGIGFDEAIVKEKGTMGINNMHLRSQLLNGSLMITSQPKAGCSLMLNLSVPSATA